MIRASKFFTLLAFLSPLMFTTPTAAASLTALISIHEGSTDMWEQRADIQDLLKSRFGFGDVQFLVDATPGEIPERMKAFLEQPADPDDRRLVWVSGFDPHQDSTVCAGGKFQTIHPRTSSLILAPDCYTDIIALPQGARHYAMTAPTQTTRAARIGRTRATNAPWIAVLTLPSENEAVIQGTNDLVFEHLKLAPQMRLDPVALLHHLRTRFRWNGSDFTPTLDLFDRGLSREQLRPFGIAQTAPAQEAIDVGTPRRLRNAFFEIYTKPDASDGGGMSLRADMPVRVLRRDRDGQMRYASVGSSLFGWIKSDDLAE